MSFKLGEIDIAHTQNILSKVNVGNIPYATLWQGTKAEYDALAEHSPVTLYFIIDDNDLEVPAPYLKSVAVSTEQIQIYDSEGNMFTFTPSVTKAMNYGGTVSDWSELPTTGLTNGLMYVNSTTGTCKIYNEAKGAWDDAGSTAVTVDSTLDKNSTNPIQNKPVAIAIENINTNITNLTTSVNSKFPSAGGTLTGPITFASSVNYIMKSAVDNSWFGIFAGTDSDSAGMFLNGKSTSGSKPGTFAIKTATISSAAAKYLIGYPDGRLIWNDKNVITAAGGTISGALTLEAETTLTNGAITCKEKNLILKHTNAVDYTGIYGGSYVNNGASIIVAGASNASTPGQILLKVCTSASDMKVLILKPDGTLTWNDKTIYHAGNLLANPTESGTKDLTKLQIGSTVYNMPTMPVGAIYETLAEGAPTMAGTWEALQDREEWDEIEQDITPAGGSGTIHACLRSNGDVQLYFVNAASGDGKIIPVMPADFLPELDTVAGAGYADSSPIQFYLQRDVGILYTTGNIKAKGSIFYKTNKDPDRTIHRWKRTA